ncbi:hypothetical protein VB735_16435 [Halotia wernerae UHCC 0503]|nr:hypothetical protein [Halotia wernerae UHCC 0503]
MTAVAPQGSFWEEVSPQNVPPRCGDCGGDPRRSRTRSKRNA